MEAAAKFVGLCWIIFVVVWGIFALSVKRTREQQPFFGRLLYVLLAAVVVVLLNGRIREVHLRHQILPHTLELALVGDAIVLAGLVLAVWARIVLGGNWSSRVAIKENHELIQRGPYHVVRHPIYSGLLMMILGTAVLVGEVGAFVGLLVCFCGFWIKFRQEEALLTNRLPGYSEYKAQTKALVPFLF